MSGPSNGFCACKADVRMLKGQHRTTITSLTPFGREWLLEHVSLPISSDFGSGPVEYTIDNEHFIEVFNHFQMGGLNVRTNGDVD